MEHRDDLEQLLLAGLSEAERQHVEMAIARTHQEQLYRRLHAEGSRRGRRRGRATMLGPEDEAG